MNYSEEYDLTLKVMQLEQEFTAKSSNQTPETPVPPVVWNSKAQVTARSQELHDNIRDRVMIKADGITFEGTCARWVTCSLIGLAAGVLIFKPTAFGLQ